jgi:hypothetical protein
MNDTLIRILWENPSLTLLEISTNRAYKT